MLVMVLGGWASGRRRAFMAALFLVLSLAGCGSSAGGSTAPATPSATAAPPTATAASTTPRTASPAPASLSALAARDGAYLRRSSYTPETYVTSRITGNAEIIVFHTVCTGSADGHCQAIQVFRGRDTTPIWTGHYAGVKSFGGSPNGFTVTSIQYAASDPLCCPSLPPLTRRYEWNGRAFAAVRPSSRVSP